MMEQIVAPSTRCYIYHVINKRTYLTSTTEINLKPYKYMYIIKTKIFIVSDDDTRIIQYELQKFGWLVQSYFPPYFISTPF